MKFMGKDEMILSRETFANMLEAWLNESRFQGEQVDLVSFSQLREGRLKIVFAPRPVPQRKPKTENKP